MAELRITLNDAVWEELRETCIEAGIQPEALARAILGQALARQLDLDPVTALVETLQDYSAGDLSAAEAISRAGLEDGTHLACMMACMEYPFPEAADTVAVQQATTTLAARLYLDEE